MFVAAITGLSGAGKTTLIVQLIEHFVAQGRTVGAIKHTHHPLNEEVRGDTGRFQRAGADPVLLAREGEAVVFRPQRISRVAFGSPRELLAHCATEIVLVEGFKQSNAFPQLSVSADARPTLESALAELGRIWRR